jgi:succinyl-CoA synthetase alpha subunit
MSKPISDLFTARVKFDEHDAYYRLGYDSEKEPGVTFIIEGAATEHARLAPIHAAVAEVLKAAEEELRVFHDGGTESEQTGAMIDLMNALSALKAVLGE